MFYVKTATPWKKSPLSPTTPPPLWKLRSCQAPLFENLVGGSTTPLPSSPAERGGVHSMELSHKLPSDWGFRVLENQEKLEKSRLWVET